MKLKLVSKGTNSTTYSTEDGRFLVRRSYSHKTSTRTKKALGASWRVYYADGGDELVNASSRVEVLRWLNGPKAAAAIKRIEKETAERAAQETADRALNSASVARIEANMVKAALDGRDPVTGEPTRTMGALSGKPEVGTPIEALAEELADEVAAWIKSRAFRLGLDHDQFRGLVVERLVPGHMKTREALLEALRALNKPQGE